MSHINTFTQSLKKNENKSVNLVLYEEQNTLLKNYKYILITFGSQCITKLNSTKLFRKYLKHNNEKNAYLLLDDLVEKTPFYKKNMQYIINKLDKKINNKKDKLLNFLFNTSDKIFNSANDIHLKSKIQSKMKSNIETTKSDEIKGSIPKNNYYLWLKDVLLKKALINNANIIYEKDSLLFPTKLFSQYNFDGYEIIVAFNNDNPIFKEDNQISLIKKFNKMIKKQSDEYNIRFIIFNNNMNILYDNKQY